MAQFAIPTPDENLVPGWNSQGNFTGASTLGTPGAGFAQAGAAPAVAALSASYQASAGLPQPPGALNIGSENSGSQTVSVLTNPGYADGNTIIGAGVTTPTPATTAVQNPFGMNAITQLVIPSGVTAVYYAPFSPTAPSGTSAPWISVPFTSGTSQTLVFNLPPAGWVKTVGAAATSVTYQATN